MTSLTLTKPRRGDEEHQLQCGIVALLKANAADNIIWEAVNSGGFKLGPKAAARQKAMGIRKGSPDLHFVLADGSAAFIECKSGKGLLSPEQVAYRNQCSRIGIPYVVVQSIDQAIAVLNGWRVFKTKVVG